MRPGPRLATAFGSERDRYDSAAEVQKFSGVAPVTESSGKMRWVHWRLACPKFLRQTFHEFADASRKKSLWAQAYYQQRRQHGASHPCLGLQVDSHPLASLSIPEGRA